MSQLFEKIKNKENNWFENAIMLLIFISACLIGLETIPGLSSEMSHILHTVDNIIISIFVAEVFIKMYANKPTPFDYFKDAWNLFDFIIVALSILPWLFEASSVVEAVIVFRLVRLTRVLRVLRFFSFVKPLQRLVNTLFQSLPSMSYVALIILILFYVYGIMGVFMFKVSDPEHYGDLSSAVLTLFQTITGEGWPDLLATQIENGNTLIASIFYISFIVIGSMIILNLFIGVLVSELENIRELDASGRKQTYDTDHVVILGWSDNISIIFNELLMSLEGKKRIIAVVLAEKSKADMAAYFSQNIKNSSRLSITFRTGSPTVEDDLKIANVQYANSIIIISEDEDNSKSTQILLLLHKIFENKAKMPYISFILNNPALRPFCKNILNDRFLPVDNNGIISRIIALSILEPLTFKVYEELLSFEGREVYVKRIDKAAGQTFGNLINNFKDALLIGIKRTNNEIVFLPEHDYVIGTSDELIAIADDSESFEYSEISKRQTSKSTQLEFNTNNAIKNILIIGFNDYLFSVIDEMDSYGKDFNIEILITPKILPELPEITNKTNNIKISIGHYLHNDYDQLLLLDWQKYDRIYIINYSDFVDFSKADTEAVLCYTYIKDILTKQNLNIEILAEIVNTKLGEDLMPDNYLSLQRLTYAILAQFALNPDSKQIIEAIFNTKSFEIAPIKYEDLPEDLILQFDARAVVFGKYNHNSHKIEKIESGNLLSGDKIILLKGQV